MEDASDISKFDIQDVQYSFPYHYIPSVLDCGPSPVRVLPWGLEYLCCLAHVKETVVRMAPKRLLDVGCGDGRLIYELTNVVPELTGIDISSNAIAFARAFNPQADVRRQAVQDLVSEGRVWDVITLMEVIEHIPDSVIPSFLGAVAKLCKPGGYVVITVPGVAKPIIPKHFRHYDSDLLKRQVTEAGLLEPVSVDYFYRETVLDSLIRRLLINKYWTVYPQFLAPRIWSYIWNHRRHASRSTGYHVCGVFRRSYED